MTAQKIACMLKYVLASMMHSNNLIIVRDTVVVWEFGLNAT